MQHGNTKCTTLKNECNRLYKSNLIDSYMAKKDKINVQGTEIILLVAMRAQPTSSAYSKKNKIENLIQLDKLR